MAEGSFAGIKDVGVVENGIEMQYMHLHVLCSL